MKLGTRKSRLALAQSGMIARALGPDVELVGVETEGDRLVDVPLRGPLGKGFFTEDLERRLLDGRIELAVHSLKDVPVQAVDGLVLAAIPERADAADVVVIEPSAFAEAPAPGGLPLRGGARVGSTSPRRQALLRHHGAGLVVEELRGNVTTRVERLRQGRFDAIVLAAAGLARLGGEVDLRGLRVVRLDPRTWPCAPGQGALAVQCRADDAITRGRIAALHHAPTAAAVALERDLLALLGGGCQLPFGAFVQGEAWAFALGSGAGVIVRQGTGASAARAALRALAEVRAGEADHETYGCEWEEVHVGA